MKITVLGAGAWGTALARLLHQGKHAVTLWGHSAEHLSDLRRSGCNERYLPGITLPRELVFEGDIKKAIEGAEGLVIAIPSQAFRDVARNLGDYAGTVVSVTKGIEYQTGLTMCGILAENAPRAKSAAVSGPNFAFERAVGI